MNLRTLIGYTLLALPFIAVTVAMVKSMGWRETLGIWATALAILGCVFGGVILVTG